MTASTSFLIGVLAMIAVAIALLRLVGWQIVRREAVASRRASIPLTVFALITLLLLAGVVAVVLGHHGTLALDQWIDDAFGPYRAPWLIEAFQWITAIGAGPSITAMLVTASALLWSSDRRSALVPLWIAFLGAQATTWSSKYIIDRPRPVFLPNITEWNPSFPSGHATATTALIGTLGYLVACGAPELRARFETAFWTTMLIGLVCFSRLFLGVHFFTDVIAGILVGLFWLLVGCGVHRSRSLRRTGEV